MSPKFLFIALLAAIPLASLQAQEGQQSLGEAARQARKAKEGQTRPATASKGVITEDSLPAGHAAGSSRASALDNANASLADRFKAGRAKLDESERALNQLAPMDRSSLANLALDGRSGDFPGRRVWEDKLFAAKEHYVSHGRELVAETKQVLDEIQSLSEDGKTSASSPHAQELSFHARQLMQDAFQTEANFQAVILEGQQLAKRTGSF